MLPIVRSNIPGPRSLALARELHEVESRNVTFVDPEGRFPIFWESAADCIVTDVDGNTFLDLTAAFGVASVGHCNPRVVRAIQEQAARLIHGMGDVHPTAVKVELARVIAEKTPGDLSGVILGADGADAVEAALKTARLHTGRPGVLAFEGAYHGLTYGALAVTARSDFRAPFADQAPTFGRHVAYGDSAAAAAALAADATIGAVVVEPIQGRGGIVVPPAGYLAELLAICHRHDAVLIADEIFTGWGRTGHLFACEEDGIVPDILCIGKAMGGGFPISACVARPPIAAAWSRSTGEALHTSTFLGSPLGARAALAAIAEIVERDLPARARVVGGYFQGRLERVKTRFPVAVREVRGRGLMLGVRFDSRERALGLVYALLRRGIIVLPAGDGDVIEFVPPLTIATEQIDWAIEQIERALNLGDNPTA